MISKLDEVLLAMATGKAACKILNQSKWVDEIEKAIEILEDLKKQERKRLGSIISKKQPDLFNMAKTYE